jgi:hypothetical protein
VAFAGRAPSHPPRNCYRSPPIFLQRRRRSSRSPIFLPHPPAVWPRHRPRGAELWPLRWWLWALLVAALRLRLPLCSVVIGHAWRAVIASGGSQKLFLLVRRTGAALNVGMNAAHCARCRRAGHHRACWPVLVAPVAEWVRIGSGRTRRCGGGRLAGRGPGRVEGCRRPVTVTRDSRARRTGTRTPDSRGPLARTLVVRAGTAARPSS